MDAIKYVLWSAYYTVKLVLMFLAGWAVYAAFSWVIVQPLAWMLR